MASKIQLRRDTAANWTTTNPVLAQGEPGVELDSKKLKIGDGTTAWATLPYASGGSDTGALIYKGATDITAAPPAAPKSGWMYVISTGGTPNAGWTGLTGNIPVGTSVFYDGTNWATIATPAPASVWVRNGTELAPTTVGDSVFTSGAVKVGGTTAAPNLQIKADGGIVANTDGLVYDAANKRLGVGTSSVSSGIKFQVQDGTASKAQFNVSGYGGLVIGQNADLSSEIDQSSSGAKLYIKQGGNTAITVDTSQRVGIGTTSASAKLTITESGNVSAIDIKSADSNPSLLSFGVNTSTGVSYIQSNATGSGTVQSLAFYGASTEWGRFDTSGRLLVGTSSWSNTSRAVFSGNSVDNLETYVDFARGTAATAANSVIGYLNFTNGGSDNCASIGCLTDGACGAGDSPGRLVFSTTADGASSPTERMRITSGGVLNCPGVYNEVSASAANVFVGATGNIQRSTSSIKYKKDVEDMQDIYADSILQCRPVWYKSTCQADNPDWGWWGFIAEEVAAIDPRLVHWKTTEVTYDENGSAVETPCDPEPEGVQYDRFVPHLLNLIKRQQQAIETLEAKVAALQGGPTKLDDAGSKGR